MAFCTECGASIDPAAKFCTSCGQRVRASSTLVAPQRRPRVGHFFLRIWRFLWPASSVSMRRELLLVLLYVTVLILALRAIATR